MEKINKVDHWSDDVALYIDKKLLPIQKVNNNLVYNYLIRAKTKQPTSLNTWVELYPFLEKFNWRDVFTLPYKTTKESYIQSFQCKILTRILNCNHNLHKWGIRDSPLCTYCRNVDTIQHHLYECEESRKFWNSVENWIHKKLHVKFNFVVCEVIFGLSLAEDPIFEVLNCIIMYAKCYINTKRNVNKSLLFSEFLFIIEGKLTTLIEVEKDCCNDITNKVRSTVAIYKLLLA